MPSISRRNLWIGAAVTLCASRQSVPKAQAQPSGMSPTPHQHFIEEAERMRRQAVSAGDQSYGAVVVRADEIIGWGPSRVITDRNRDAHAERVAIRDAQRKAGSTDLAGAFLYSTSRACPLCEAAAANAGISRMYWGPKGADAGPPRG